LKVASDLAASITERRFVLRFHHSKYAEVKKQIIASDEKVANLKAMIKRLEASLATEESNRAKIDEVLDTIETGVITARDGLVSDIAQVSAMEGTTKAANQLVAQRQSAWESLRNTFTEVYSNLHVREQLAQPTS
jgi:septal ring factor EnvC (AmiA/AmiB activator)